MDVISLLLNAEAGTLVGFVGGELVLGRRSSLLRNASLGLVGGVVGGWLLLQFEVLPPAGSSVTALLGHALGSGVSGGAVTVLVGWLWNVRNAHRHRSLPPPHRSSLR